MIMTAIGNNIQLCDQEIHSRLLLNFSESLLPRMQEYMYAVQSSTLCNTCNKESLLPSFENHFYLLELLEEHSVPE